MSRGYKYRLDLSSREDDGRKGRRARERRVNVREGAAWKDRSETRT